MITAARGVVRVMQVEIWSDVVCPWCYIGKRRFEAALARFEHRDQVEVIWRSFELDPNAPRWRPGRYAERLAGKYGMSVPEAQASIDHMVEVGRADGVAFNFDIARPGNTFDAHRLLHLARQRGLGDALKERFLTATFTEGEAIGDPETLTRLAVEAGLDPHQVAVVLDSDAYAADVRADQRRAFQLGITAVPFFVVDNRYGVPGAQPADTLLKVLEDTWNEHAPAESRDGGACADESCAI
jgi:predicted DsbA family dithiol-disulfide isomerase